MAIGGHRVGRRGFILLGTGAASFYGNIQRLFAASDFWNKKDPTEWSAADIQLLLSRSPWAKEVRLESRAEATNTYDGSSPVGSGLPGDPSTGMQTNGTPGGAASQRDAVPVEIGGPASQRGAERRQIPVASAVAIVRWESAEPIMNARKTSFPEDFQEHYVIGVSGLRIPPAERPEMLENLHRFTVLTKGKDRIQPGIVEYSKDGSIVFFGFSKELFPLTTADKDVEFAINTGDLIIKARFDPKEMIYRGRLAI